MSPDEKELLRHAVLECLYAREPNYLPTRAILRVVARELLTPPTEQDVLAALDLLKGLELAADRPDEFGSTRYWLITAKGILHFERSSTGH